MKEELMYGVDFVEVTQARPDPNAKVFDLEALNKAKELITERYTNIPEAIARISHNVNENDLLKAFDAKKVTSEYNVASLYGLPVDINKLIPKGEIWLMNKKGGVIKKYQI